jgi:hypothetical protein
MAASQRLPLPLHYHSYDRDHGRASHYARDCNEEKQSSAPKQKNEYAHQTSALVLPHAGADLHVLRCKTRAAASASSGAKADSSESAASSVPAFSSSTAAAPAAEPSSPDLSACGNFKYQPRFGDCSLGVIPAADPPAAGASSTVVGSSAPVIHASFKHRPTIAVVRARG